MSKWKIPDRDTDRIDTIRNAVEREDMLPESERVLLDGEIVEMRYFIRQYEGETMVLKNAKDDKAKTMLQYKELFKNAQMYISHFIRVLQLTVIRKEIPAALLMLYGFESDRELNIPDLATEDAILSWGDKIIRGEQERISRGGRPLYNPTIANVRVHYELFDDIIQSLKIYSRNVLRYQTSVFEMRRKAAGYIDSIWSRVDEKYSKESEEKYQEILKLYKFLFYNSGEQLNVFN
ncbi:MAG: hypothetical protein LBS54_00845 [Dysgonamonadaceae bacterium]|jgi:hypothetical protein|nr:hypothetical protein [Dysgonamonadaceae bacterium]